jgi:TM2 domain-containing membrane protein YozV
MFCSKCGAENPDGAKFCAKCGNALAAPVAPPTVAPDTVRAAAAPAAAAVPTPTGKTPWIAAVLSFFISGLGQLYNNDWKKGLVMFFGAVLGIFLTGGLATLAIWIWGMVDGYQVAAGKGRVW